MLADLGIEDFTSFEGGHASVFSSPAMPNVFDMGSASSGASNMGTVSPQDLLLQEPFMSAPNSTALTSLTSPSVFNGSPAFSEYDVSPNFAGNELDPVGDTNWYPLFPQGDTIKPLPQNSSAAQHAQQQPPPQQNSPATDSDDIDIDEDASASPARRRKPGASPPLSTSGGRHSSVSGVGSRRRDKPLPPIIVEDPSDTVAMKRARNTLAARKSRERKALRFDELEDTIAKLKVERDHWKNLAISLGASSSTKPTTS